MRHSAIMLVGVCGLVLAGCQSVGGLRGETSQQKARQAAEVHTELGQQYLQRGDLQTALQKLLLAEKYDDSYAPEHTVLGVLYERIKEYPKAEREYKRAYALEPTKGDANNNLGAFLCRIGKVDEALPYFKRAVADPFYHTPDVAYANAGTCLLKVGQLQPALTDFKQALALNPKNSDALYQTAVILHKQGDDFHASAFVQRFEALGLASPAVLKLGYDIETKLGDQEAARSYARRLRDQFPDSEQARSLPPGSPP